MLVNQISRQWWGTLTSPATRNHLWLVNGAARYSELLWLEDSEGPSLAELEMMVEDLEEWRAEQGALPGTLDELTDASDAWSYRLTGEAGYQISHTVDGVTVSYDSSQDPDEHFSSLYEP